MGTRNTLAHKCSIRASLYVPMTSFHSKYNKKNYPCLYAGMVISVSEYSGIRTGLSTSRVIRDATESRGNIGWLAKERNENYQSCP